MKILDVKVDNIGFDEAVDRTVEWLGNGEPKIFTIVTPNPEIIVQAQTDLRLCRILNDADLSVPDGVGLVWVAGKTPVNVRRLQVVPGVELMRELCRIAAEKGWVVGLYGGRGGVARRALMKLKEKYKKLKGWSREPGKIDISQFDNHVDWRVRKEERGVMSQLDNHVVGSLRQEIEWVVEKIDESSTRIVFVGLGAPKQEYFINKIQNTKYKIQDTLVLMAVGGAFDEIAGRVRPAPEWVRQAGLKWLWRLVLQPWRIKRQLKLVRFVWLILREKYGRAGTTA